MLLREHLEIWYGKLRQNLTGRRVDRQSGCLPLELLVEYRCLELYHRPEAQSKRFGNSRRDLTYISLDFFVLGR